MDAQIYDAWYETSRGKWIGQCEAALVLENLSPCSGESILDVGCGTGYFTRTLAAAVAGNVTGADINPDWVKYARSRDQKASYMVAEALALPYADGAFDRVMSITALCFMSDVKRAVCEMLRVARRRFVIGCLNKHSLLYLQKGRRGGQGGYRGAHWHTAKEITRLFRSLPVQNLQVFTVVQIPSGGWFARRLETRWLSALPFGAFIVVAGDIAAV
jgi:ubiquinone/menaquinone biosynthesis C-methylase UbiE